MNDSKKKGISQKMLMKEHGTHALSKKQQKEKTKNWPVMQKDFKPKDKFEELAASHLRK